MKNEVIRNELGFIIMKRLRDLKYDIPKSKLREKLLSIHDQNYNHDGFDYIFHKRVDRVCLYSQILDGVFLGYEVVVLKYHRQITSKGQVTPERFSKPKDEDWGDYGWTYKSVHDAEKKFNYLIKLV
jgi:hypothetical protein